MHLSQRLALYIALTAAYAVLAGCASTTVAVTPSPQLPVCDSAAAALVLWAPQWRPDQKDVPERESAATAGLQEFLQGSGCFARSELRRVPNPSALAVSAELVAAPGRFEKILVITLRELGPVVKLLSSAALVEGGTQVLLQVEEYPSSPGALPTRAFQVSWQNGGPGVVKGVASLPQDMRAALVAGLQPARQLK